MNIQYHHELPAEENLLELVSRLGRPVLLLSKELLSRPEANGRYPSNIFYFDSGKNPFESNLCEGLVTPNRVGITRITSALAGLYEMSFGPDIPGSLLICAYGGSDFYDSWQPLVEPVANFKYNSRRISVIQDSLSTRDNAFF